jgi:serine/threonine-protein kinase
MSEVGDLIADRYRLVRLVARGGMGAVYEAQHTFLGRRVAIKLIAGDSFRRPASLERFEREAKAAGSLESEHIAAVVDYGVAADGAPFLVMEYVEGEDLARVLERYRVLPAIRAVNLAIDLCRGLERAHTKGIVHRDLKPSNVIVARRSDGADLAKILDFGVAKLPGDPASTQPGTLLGTALYMPPEQARDAKSVDHRADIYAVGVMLYEMLSGERPHDGDTPNAVVYHLLHERVTPVREHRPDLPPELAEVVERAMASDVDARFATAAELARALAPFAGDRRAVEEAEVGAAQPDPSTPRVADLTATSAEAVELVSRAPEAPEPTARHGTRALVAAVAAVVALGIAYTAWPTASRVATPPATAPQPSAASSAPVAPPEPPASALATMPTEPTVPPTPTPPSATATAHAQPPLRRIVPDAARSAEPAKAPDPARVHFDRDNPYGRSP